MSGRRCGEEGVGAHPLRSLRENKPRRPLPASAAAPSEADKPAPAGQRSRSLSGSPLVFNDFLFVA